MASSTIRFASASFDTSATTATACPPPATTSSTTDCAAGSVTSATTTFAPSTANMRAATRPMPLAPPVMIVTLSCSRMPALLLECWPLMLAALQVALALPGMDDRVVQPLLDPRRVEVVVHHVLPEDLHRGLRGLELVDRLVQRTGHARHTRRDVAIALELGLQLELVLDAVQPRSDHRRIREVGVHVAAGEAVLDVEGVP